MRMLKLGSVLLGRLWATRRIKRQCGVESGLQYLPGEKLVNFAEAAEQRPEFAAELPRFQAVVWNVFNPYELAGSLTTLQPSRNNKLQKLLYGSRWRVRPSPLYPEAS